MEIRPELQVCKVKLIANRIKSGPFYTYVRFECEQPEVLELLLQRLGNCKDIFILAESNKLLLLYKKELKTKIVKIIGSLFALKLE